MVGVLLPIWNAHSLMHVHKMKGHLSYSDVSGNKGCSAICVKRWIQYPWHSTWLQRSIAVKELLPIVLACALWGQLWAHKHMEVWCDNVAVVDILRARTSKCKVIMHLLRCVRF